MKRDLTKAEVLAQLAEKERRIHQHLEVMKEEGVSVSHSLAGRAEEAGEKLDELIEQAKELAPVIAGVGLGLWFLGRMVSGAFRRRRRPERRMTHEEIVLLSDALAERLSRAGVAPTVEAVAEPAPRRRRGDLLPLVLATLAGAAVKLAVAHVDWERLYAKVRGGEEVVEAPAATPDRPTEDELAQIHRMAEEVLVVTPRRPQASDFDL